MSYFFLGQIRSSNSRSTELKVLRHDQTWFMHNQLLVTICSIRTVLRRQNNCRTNQLPDSFVLIGHWPRGGKLVPRLPPVFCSQWDVSRVCEWVSAYNVNRPLTLLWHKVFTWTPLMLHPQVNTTLHLHFISSWLQKVLFFSPLNDSDLLCSLTVLVWQVLNLGSVILNKNLFHM